MIRIVDLFCGAGGESTGIVQALRGSRYDLAAVNHWDVAIETHRRNHPQARHYQADIQALSPLEVVGARDRLDLLWASPECTHHSVARGGRPCSDQSRASAWLILKWLSEVYVHRVILENVPEFTGWGPLGRDGKPLKSKKGETFKAFIHALEHMGYRVEWKYLCAADYGDPTTRTRFFLQAVRGRGAIAWPRPTHAQVPGLFGEQPWIPARNVIDWTIRGKSILNRDRPLAPATMRRIEAGIRRYWGKWAEPFLVILRGTGVSRETSDPLPAVTAGGNHLGLVEPFMVVSRGQSTSRDIDQPTPTVTCSGAGHIGLVEPFMVPHYGERPGQDPRTHEIGQPVPTIPASGGGKFGLVEPFFLQVTHGGRLVNGTNPLPTVTCAKRGEFGVVSPLILHQCSAGRPRSVDEPLPPVLTRGAISLVEGEPVSLDITFRMLQPHELAAAQGFPREYWFAGNKGDQVKQIGNAVPVNEARALAEAAFSA